ncbi:phage antirepressor N-terminal domain-containing protein [Comamonas sp. 4034]|uniref:phage antirepressor N-terminal domain-containing protein n=1 Tax=Comamonas sp. 4034 TaxID=3156455 RepID=UPI003D1FF528
MTAKGNAPEVAATEASSVKNQLLTEGINMSDCTEVAPVRAITVPFHGAELYVVDHDGQPYTPMKALVAAMGLNWSGQFEKVKENELRWGVRNIRIPSEGGVQEAVALPLRKLPGWMATLEPKKMKSDEARARVIQYQNECDEVLWQYWNDGVAVNPRALYSVNPGDVLTKEEADTLRQLIESTAKKLAGDSKMQGKFILQAWSKLKSHFKVGYREIPRHELTEAISIVNRHTVEWEVVDERAPQEGTVNEMVADWVKKLEEPNGYGFVPFLPLVEVVQRKMGYKSHVTAGEPATIDTHSLMVSDLKDDVSDMPIEVQEAIETKAMLLAVEAHNLARKHLRQRVAYEAVTGYPNRAVNISIALDAVKRGGLGEALAYKFHSEVRSLRRRADFLLEGTQQLLSNLETSARTSH